MTSELQIRRTTLVLGTAIALTTLAELFYLVVWGMVLFPAGSWPGKAVWTMTCGLAMGSVIGGLTLLWVEGRHEAAGAILRAAVVVAGVGSYCAWLCSRIDARFNYFGGPENGALCIASGVLPALAGGLLFGWFLYRKPAPQST